MNHRLLLTAALLAGAFALPATTVYGATFTVINTNATGAGSLEQAISDANASVGPDTITFNIPGTGLQTIAVDADSLPALISGDTTIDATTQPGYVVGGAPLIYLDGTATANPGVCLFSSNNVVRGLGFVNFGSALDGALLIRDDDGNGADSNVVTGNYIGVTSTGAASPVGNFGIKIDVNAGAPGAGGASSNVLGGATAAERNVIAGFASQGIDISGGSATKLSSNNQIIGNAIGVNAAGTAALGGLGASVEAGIRLGSWTNGTIIGTNGNGLNDATEGNIIGGIARAGSGTDCVAGRAIQLITSGAAESPKNTVIAGNRLGVNATDSGTIANDCGILVASGSGTLIGGDLPVEANIIAGNNRYGIFIQNARSTLNTVRGNRIGIDGADNLRGNTLGGISVRGGALSNTIGPDNSITANGGNAVRVASGSNGTRIIGNLLNTDGSGNTVSNATARGTDAAILIDGGTGIVIEDNVVGANLVGRIGVLIQPSAAGSITEGHTIRNNRIGLSRGGNRLAPAGAGARGVVLDGTRNITMTANRIAANESGAVIANTGRPGAVEPVGLIITGNTFGGAPCSANLGNTANGLQIDRAAAGNTIGLLGAGNTFACNGNGVRVGAQASGQVIVGNSATANIGVGVLVDGATGVQISRTTTSANGGAGISLANGGNASIAAPSALTYFAFSGAPTLRGTLPQCAGCTLEVFTSATSNTSEGPVFLSSRSVSGTSFAIVTTGAQRYLTATLRDANGNTSAFSIEIDTERFRPRIFAPVVRN